jgi:hypothetical protein
MKQYDHADCRGLPQIDHDLRAIGQTHSIHSRAVEEDRREGSAAEGKRDEIFERHRSLQLWRKHCCGQESEIQVALVLTFMLAGKYLAGSTCSRNIPLVKQPARRMTTQ